MEAFVVPEGAQRRERWRNGAGWTREIHARGDGRNPGAGWLWRLSVAEIEADAPFSSFPGVDRELVLLSGNGLRLRFDDGEVAELLPPHDRLRFAGERPVAGELLDGPTTDFNLMWRRDAVHAELWRRPLVGRVLLFVEPGTTWVVHQLAGTVRFDAEAGLPVLSRGDTAVLPAAHVRRRFALEGNGEALVVAISPVASPAAYDGDPGTASSR